MIRGEMIEESVNETSRGTDDELQRTNDAKQLCREASFSRTSAGGARTSNQSKQFRDDPNPLNS